MIKPIDFLNKLADTLTTVTEVVELPDGQALGLVRTAYGYTRVAVVSAYLNRAKRPQVTMMFKDFKQHGDAETLYLQVLEMNGGLAFGDALDISAGSGARIRSIE